MIKIVWILIFRSIVVDAKRLKHKTALLNSISYKKKQKPLTLQLQNQEYERVFQQTKQENRHSITKLHNLTTLNKQ